ncbi:hypothetical protein FOVSG1_009060 [Fusarium oxysporum f. sp. vasinfectum]
MATGCVRTIVSVLLPKVGQISPISIGQPDAPSAGYAVLSIDLFSLVVFPRADPLALLGVITPQYPLHWESKLLVPSLPAGDRAVRGQGNVGGLDFIMEGKELLDCVIELDETTGVDLIIHRSFL